jgi:hypothetical protein
MALRALMGAPRPPGGPTELVGNFERELGDGLSAVQKLNVRRAAMLVTIAETMAAQQLAGEPISIKQLVRADNVARRAVRDLALERRGKPGRPSLATRLTRNAAGAAALNEYLSSKAAAKAAWSVPTVTEVTPEQANAVRQSVADASNALEVTPVGINTALGAQEDAL